MVRWLVTLLKKTGAKPLADVVAGENGILSVLRDKSDPKRRISSKRSAAAALIFAAIAFLTAHPDPTWPQAIIMVIWVGVGGALLWRTMKEKPVAPDKEETTDAQD